MKVRAHRILVLIAILVGAPLRAADVKVDLGPEKVGKPPTTFEPMVGTWLVAQDGPDKVIRVDGSPWKASQDYAVRAKSSSE